jgi:hypothetical protein
MEMPKQAVAPPKAPSPKPLLGRGRKPDDVGERIIRGEFLMD